MISAVLAFIHARKWVVELILLAALAGSFALYRAHLIELGKQLQKAADARELEIERKAAQAQQDKAEHTHDQELITLRDYRDKHPFSYRVCIQPAMQSSSSANSSDVSAAATATVGERVPEATPDITEDRGPLLDAFAALFEESNATLRMWQPK